MVSDNRQSWTPKIVAITLPAIYTVEHDVPLRERDMEQG